MPTSLPMFDEQIELYFREARPGFALDVGPGEGKYGRLIRAASPATRLIGVEIDEEYVRQFKLREFYDEVIVGDASVLMADPRRKFDAVIVGDCIEHMRKNAGVDLLHFLVYRSKVIFVKFPVQMVQNDSGGHVSEAHVSVWSEQDFRQFDHIYLERDLMRLSIVRGYLSNDIEWLPQKLMQQLGYASCAAHYDERPERWELADLQTRRREATIRELSAIIGPEDRFILADEMQSDLWEWAGRRGVPFMENDGQYWGMPADDAAAIEELDRQRAAGAKFIVFISPTTWALTHYTNFAHHLAERYRKVIENDRIVVLALGR
jgi:phospholipid N-methyltransferase